MLWCSTAEVKEGGKRQEWDKYGGTARAGQKGREWGRVWGMSVKEGWRRNRWRKGGTDSMRGSTGGKKDRKDVKKGWRRSRRRTRGGGERAEWKEGGREQWSVKPGRLILRPVIWGTVFVYFLSSFRHRDRPGEGGEDVGHLDRPISPTPIV